MLTLDRFAEAAANHGSVERLLHNQTNNTERIHMFASLKLSRRMRQDRLIRLAYGIRLRQSRTQDRTLGSRFLQQGGSLWVYATFNDQKAL
jgi:CRP-like cAMP-binding protein